MKKHLISLTKRQSSTLSAFSEENELSLSELVRRAVDTYIDSLVEKGDLVRHEFSTSEKTATIETPRKMFQDMCSYVKANPDGPLKIK